MEESNRSPFLYTYVHKGDAQCSIFLLFFLTLTTLITLTNKPCNSKKSEYISRLTYLLFVRIDVNGEGPILHFHPIEEVPENEREGDALDNGREALDNGGEMLENEGRRDFVGRALDPEVDPEEGTVAPDPLEGVRLRESELSRQYS